LTPTTDAEHLTPLPSLLNGDMSQSSTIELPKVAPGGLEPCETPLPEVIQVNIQIFHSKTKKIVDLNFFLV
jgi:hypothetical protein